MFNLEEHLKSRSITPVCFLSFQQYCCRSYLTMMASVAHKLLIMLFKIIHGVVAIALPSYFKQPLRMTRHISLTQIHTAGYNFYKYSFFPQWNRLPAAVVVLTTLEHVSGCLAQLKIHCVNLFIILTQNELTF